MSFKTIAGGFTGAFWWYGSTFWRSRKIYQNYLVALTRRCGDFIYHQLRARRALSIFKDVPLRTRRAQLLYKVYGDSVLLVLSGTSLNSDSALLFSIFSWWQKPSAEEKLLRVGALANKYDYFQYSTLCLKVLGKSVGLCKTTKRKDQLYISLLVSV